MTEETKIAKRNNPGICKTQIFFVFYYYYRGVTVYVIWL